MKQTITIEAQFRCEKCRSKAMEIAVTEDGVISVAFKGANRDQMVITGDGVDAAGLAKSLRKKLGYADLLSAEEITEKKAQKKSEPEREKKTEPEREKKTEHAYVTTPLPGEIFLSHHPHQLEFYISDPPPRSTCTIL